MDAEQKLLQEFTCTKCRCREAVSKTASLGSGLPHLLNLSPDRYILISCGACGFTEIYNTQAFALETRPVTQATVPPEVPQAP